MLSVGLQHSSVKERRAGRIGATPASNREHKDQREGKERPVSILTSTRSFDVGQPRRENVGAAGPRQHRARAELQWLRRRRRWGSESEVAAAV